MVAAIAWLVSEACMVHVHGRATQSYQIVCPAIDFGKLLDVLIACEFVYGGDNEVGLAFSLLSLIEREMVLATLGGLV